MKHRGVLLVNLGSPNSFKVKDVRNYLNEFLMDPHVIDMPWILRRLIVSCLVLPFRPKKSAAAYKSIWTDQGSPLLEHSWKLTEKLHQTTNIPIEIAMRYGNPSIEKGLTQLLEYNVDEILVIPLYPHYAMSSYKTAIEKTKVVVKNFNINIPIIYHPVFYDDKLYIQALVDSAKPWLEKPYDHLLFSFHGVPERHIKKDDPTSKTCLHNKKCCEIANANVHNTCYRYQVNKTMNAFAKLAGINKDNYSLGFQSKLGRDKWLTPNTLKVLDLLASKNKKKVLIICPSFVSDCLESLEEIGIAAKEYFKDSCGGDLELIPCMNQHPSWIKALSNMINYNE